MGEWFGGVMEGLLSPSREGVLVNDVPPSMR